jgi:hypothetical protein
MIIILRDSGNITINEQETLFTSHVKEKAEVIVAYKDRDFVVDNVTGVRYVKDSPIDETDNGKVMEELEKAKKQTDYFRDMAMIYFSGINSIEAVNAGESITKIIEATLERANNLAKQYGKDKEQR